MTRLQNYNLSNQNDHDKIVVIGTELWGVMTNLMHDRARVEQQLNLLKASMLLHFSDEEAAMNKHKYHNASQHKRSHDYILSILAEFISAFKVGRENTVPDLWPHLENTLDTHLARYDAEFSTFLESGVG